MPPTTESIPAPPDAQPIPSTAPIGLARELALVAAGGMIGALARAALTARASTTLATFPLSTQLVNAIGALALGLLLATLEQGRPRPTLRPFLAVGVLGSFTTFSTLVDDGRSLAVTRSPQLALAFLALSIALGLISFLLGERLGLWLGPGRPDRRRARGRSAA